MWLLLSYKAGEEVAGRWGLLGHGHRAWRLGGWFIARRPCLWTQFSAFLFQPFFPVLFLINPLCFPKPKISDTRIPCWCPHDLPLFGLICNILSFISNSTYYILLIFQQSMKMTSRQEAFCSLPNWGGFFPPLWPNDNFIIISIFMDLYCTQLFVWIFQAHFKLHECSHHDKVILESLFFPSIPHPTCVQVRMMDGFWHIQAQQVCWMKLRLKTFGFFGARVLWNKVKNKATVNADTRAFFLWGLT